MKLTPQKNKPNVKAPASGDTGVMVDLGTAKLKAEPVAVGSARSDMASMIRATDAGRAFLIQNAKSAGAPAALLINPEVLHQHLVDALPRRTLAQLIETLPFKRRGSPRLSADLPDDQAPMLTVRTGGGNLAVGRPDQKVQVRG
jgi:hypothetical protein